VVRVRFQDSIDLEANFDSTETIGDIYSVVKENMAQPEEPFYLFVTPPKKKLNDLSVTLTAEHLIPAAVVYFAWETPSLGCTARAVLKEEVFSQLEAESLTGNNNNYNNINYNINYKHRAKFLLIFFLLFLIE